MAYPMLGPTGPIPIAEDDLDDQFILKQAFAELGITDRVHYLTYPVRLLEYLLADGRQPFLILCETNLPGMGGLELKASIDQDPLLRLKSIPFLFFSTAASRHLIADTS